MADDPVLYDVPAAGVARITLNRPAERNRWGRTERALIDALAAEALADPEVRAVILTGAGGHFTAGGNIKEFGAIEVVEQLGNVRAAQTMARRILQADKPFVAAVEGWAAGAGVGAACLCDVVVGDPTTKFVLSFAKIGMTPDLGLHQTLAQRVGVARARRMLLRAETVEAQEALSIGLLDELVGAGAVQDRALEIAQAFAAAPPNALAGIKRGMRLTAIAMEAVLEYEASTMAVSLTGREVAEGARAFLEKRAPDFRTP
jgi:2-(1,2-epoxy-1,2-dihydrophenyl)acetyl-CoA isomerase